MKRILLLLDQKENQQLLADELAGSHEVITGRADADLQQEFDLCVVDGRSLDRLWEHVQARKQAEQPIMLPVLLVTSRPGVKMVTRHVWRSIDELIISPIEKIELRARIEILLRARALSLELRQRADAAEQATRARDDVLGMVSHDLRNPLNVVLASSSFLLDTADGLRAKDRNQLEMVHRAAQLMNRLIGDLLDISGMEAGHVSIDRATIPLEPLVREACAVHQHAATAKGIDIACTFEPDLPRATVDGDRILQVLGNLIGNALKFTPGGGRVRVRADYEPGAARVRLSVSDNGAGIAPEDLPHVFDRFWQAQRTRDGGAGLGLAICRSIVRAHGGDIHVESEVGRGTTFSFTLPVDTADAAAAAVEPVRR